MSPDVYQKSLELHKKHRGKVEVISKVSLNSKEDLSLAYSPGVAEASREIARNPESVRDLTIKGNSIAIVSDGSAILGLGNLGPHAAIPVMEGKAALFKRFANIDAIPLCLNTQDEDEIVAVVKAIAPSFGGINLEDIAAPRCFNIERRLQTELDIPVMHDDQHGTAVVVLAGLVNALKLRGSEKESVKIIINGAGAAGMAITELLIEYGFKDIIVCDSKGVIGKHRTDLNKEKAQIAEVTNKGGAEGSLDKAVRNTDIFIGVSKAGLLTGDMVKTMNEKPIIFALANPQPEIMPEDAKGAGAFIVATGRSDYPNQVNNALAFPGIFRGALDNGLKQFNNGIFTKAALALSEAVENPTPEKIIPSIFDNGIVDKVAKVIN